MLRPVKEGDVCYIRVRVAHKESDAQLGTFAVEPISRVLTRTRPGTFIYVDRNELITQQEAREAVK